MTFAIELRRPRSPRRAFGTAMGAVLSYLGLALLLAVPASAEPSPEPLLGKTYDFEWDGRDIGHPERAWLGRAYVPPQVAEAKRAVPLVVFLHGLNAALIKHRWMGGGQEGDVRRIVGGLVDQGIIPPVVVAAPSSIVASQVTKGASWNRFELDRFVDLTASRLSGLVEIDERRIIVAGHSGAGCSTEGGLATVRNSKRRLLGILSIDTCMSPALAEHLVAADAKTHVVVSWQSVSWSSRPFGLFGKVFKREAQKRPAEDGVLRELDEQKPEQSPHDATVALTFERWLPKILPPASDADER